MPKKRDTHNLLMLAIVCAVALAAVYLAFSNSMSTGMGARFVSCEDSDSGQTGFEEGSQFIAGTVTAERAGGKEISRTDRCYYRSQRLIEYFCKANKRIGYRRTRCGFGCEAGACRTGSPLGGQTTCADSDEQDEPIFTPGTVTYMMRGELREKRDTCVNGVMNDATGTFKPARVNEFYCDEGKAKSGKADCPTAACNADRTACERAEDACGTSQNCASRGLECGRFKDECGIMHICGACAEGFECVKGACAETLLPDMVPARIYYKVTQRGLEPWRRVIVEVCNKGTGDMPTGAHVQLSYGYRGQSLLSMGSLSALHAGECGQAAVDRSSFTYAVTAGPLGTRKEIREIPSPTTLLISAEIKTAMEESNSRNNKLREIAVTI